MRKMCMLIAMLISSIAMTNATVLGEIGEPFDPTAMANGESRECLAYFAGCAPGKAALGYAYGGDNNIGTPQTGQDISAYVYTITRSADGTYFEVKDVNNNYWLVFPSTAPGNYSNGTPTSDTTFKSDLTLTPATSYDNAMPTGSTTYVYNISSKTNTTGYIYHDGVRMRANTDGSNATAPAAIQFVEFSEPGVPTTFFGHWIIQVDDTHYAKSAAKNTIWSAEVSSQTEWDIFNITGTQEACTISLNGRTNNIGHDNSMKMFTDQTANTKYTIVDAGNGKVKIKNNGYWVYVDNGTFTWNTDNYTELTLIPVPNYCYMISRATDRHEFQYNNALMAANTNHLTLESDTKVTTNNGVWKIMVNGSDSWTVVNGDGLPIKASLANGTIQGPYPKIHPTNVADTEYFHFSEKLNCSPNNSFTVGGVRFMTTWDAGNGETANDLQWKFEQVDLTGKEIYNVTISGADNAYVTLGTDPVQYAYDGGFFILDQKPAASDFAVAGVPDGKTGFIVMNGNEIQVTVGDRVDLFNTSNGDGIVPTYRIPGIVSASNGRLIATASRQVCGTDPGYGQVDVVCRISDDHGVTWSDMIPVAVGDASLINNVKTPMEAAYGDAAVVADRESNEVLVMAVGGCTVYGNETTTRENPNIIAYIHSSDGGETWETPIDKTEQIYSLFDGGDNVMQAGFIGSGKLFQSRIVKVGNYYRLYAALCARPNGNRVIYSDDFGKTWKALGGSEARPATDGDEPKCEELPDGRVILSSRTADGRWYNIYTYTNTTTAEGSWGTVTKSTFDGSGHTASSNPTNGEMLILPVTRKADGKDMYLALQTIPTGSGRSEVGVYYKELTDVTDMNTTANLAIDWNGWYKFSNNKGAYSSLDLMDDNRIAVIMEDNLTYFRTEPNPTSTSFPDGSGTHHYDGYDNLFMPITLETITGDRYSVNTEVNRGRFVKEYLTAVANTYPISHSKKAEVRKLAASLGDNPATAQIDKIYDILVNSPFEVEEGVVYTLKSRRQNRYATSSAAGATLGGATTLSTDGSAYWYFQKRADGKYDITNYKHQGMVSADNVASPNALNVTAAQPDNGWEVKPAYDEGWFIIVGDGIQFNQANNGAYNVLNWGEGTNTTDDGCQYSIMEVQEALRKPGSSEQAPEIIGEVNSVQDVTDNIAQGATSVNLTEATTSVVIDNDFVQEIAAATGNANTLVLAAADAEVTADDNVVVKDGDTYTCQSLKLTDGAEFATPVGFTADKARYVRDMPANKWGTLCLPYDIVQKHEGTEYDLYRIAENSGETLVLQRYADGVVPAGTPVIVYRNWEATGIDMSNNTGNINVTGNAQDGQMMLVGCLQPTPIAEGYYIANDAFWNASAIGGVTVPAFRAYIATSSDARKLNISIAGDQDATGIQALDAMNEAGSVTYGLDGRKTDEIRSGVNIVRTAQGKTYKVIIK